MAKKEEDQFMYHFSLTDKEAALFVPQAYI